MNDERCETCAYGGTAMWWPIGCRLTRRHIWADTSCERWTPCPRDEEAGVDALRAEVERLRAENAERASGAKTRLGDRR